MEIFLKALFWFALALAYAIAEIEIEGKYGWSEKTQTWYRTFNHHRNSWFLKYIMGGKPLTGYHIPVFIIAFLISHAHFFMGIPWTFSRELIALAIYTAWAPLWDNLWIIFNPYYGFENGNKEKIWWYSKTIWFFNLFPLENVFQWLLSAGFAYLAYFFSKDAALLTSHLIFMGYLLVFSALAAFTLAPLYMKWYRHMRRHDDRDKAGISH